MKREPRRGEETIDFGQSVFRAVLKLSPESGTVLRAVGTSMTVTARVRITVSPRRVTPVEVGITVNGTAVRAGRVADDGTGALLYEAALPLTAGTVTLQAFAEIADESWGSSPSTVMVVLDPPDTTAPNPPADVRPPQIDDLAPRDAVLKLDGTGDAVLTVTGGLQDPDSGGGALTLTAMADGVALPAPTVTASRFTLDVALGTAGLHTVALSATDPAGNTSSASLTVTVMPEDTVVRRYELVVIESLRLSNYLGSYGAGRTIQTFSLLPGERSRIAIKTFRTSTSDMNATNSFMDSFSGSSAKELQDAVTNEQTDSSKEDSSFKAAASVEAAGNWGVASAKVSASASYSTASARESLGKSVMNAVAKHTSEVSSRRDVKVESMTKQTQTSGDEQTVERDLENINVSRTLNFVFRQINQEFVSILHLVDIRLGLVTTFVRHDGTLLETGTGKDARPVTRYREASLAQLDGLLAETVREDRRADVRERVLAQLDTVVDHRGRRRDVVAWKTLTRPKRDADGVPSKTETVADRPYLTFEPQPVLDAAGQPVDDIRPGYDRYADETGNQIDVPGVILRAQKISLRSDGIMVDAVLGGGNALDPYSTDLQRTAIEAKRTANEKAAEEVRREQLARTLLEALDDEKAIDAYARLFGPPAPRPEV